MEPGKPAQVKFPSCNQSRTCYKKKNARKHRLGSFSLLKAIFGDPQAPPNPVRIGSAHLIWSLSKSQGRAGRLALEGPLPAHAGSIQASPLPTGRHRPAPADTAPTPPGGSNQSEPGIALSNRLTNALRPIAVARGGASASRLVG